MMSKKQWTVLLGLFLIYLLMGAGFFYVIESAEEHAKILEENAEKIEIYDLLNRHYKPSGEMTHQDILNKISVFCERPVDNSTELKQPLWDFYHSFFFAFTVVSTIGYGNLAPTTMVSRILMIFYALIGIPINGILLATLGDFFAKTFIKTHQKWKSYKVNYESWKLGLCGQIALYLIPGFLFFIFIPAYVIMVFENWDYDVAVYYAFVTLTTIGFGDFVAGVNDQNVPNNFVFVMYEVFLIVWIVFGLGYLVMVLGFITRGLRSKQMAKLEHKLACNIRNTQSKIWNGFTSDMGILRKVLNEIHMLRYKPVYRDEFNYTPTLRERSSSCPDLTLYREDSIRQKRRRAYSESVHSFVEQDIGRVQSDTDLERIDRKATFAANGLLQPCDLLAQVVNALGTYHSEADVNESSNQLQGIHGFADSQILASEKWRDSGWTIGGEKITSQKQLHRERSYSEYTIPVDDKFHNGVDWTWSGPFATKEIQEIRKKTKNKILDSTKSKIINTQGIIARIKKPFMRSKDDHRISDASDMTPAQYAHMTSDGIHAKHNPYSTHTGIGSLFSMGGGGNVLEETSVGDLIRAITSLNTQMENNMTEGSTPRRKLGTASLTPPKLPSLLTLFPPNVTPASNNGRRNSLKPLPSGSRRMSLRPPSTGSARSSRRFSVRPVELPPTHITNDKSTNFLAPPSFYQNERQQPVRTSLRIPAVERVRSHSLYPTSQNMPRPRFRPDSLRHEALNRNARTRHDSLTDIRIDKP